MKESTGHRPVRSTFLPFALPDLDESELEQIRESLESGWITTGPKVSEFEAAFASAVNAKHAVAVNSCTAAMHLALEAIGLNAGDEVITTPYTFAATAEVVRYFDARPVLVDVEPVSLNLDPALIEAAVTERTKAIIPVHVAGQAAELDSIYTLARERNLAVVEDAAHAFPTRYHGRWIGQTPGARWNGLKHLVCFSFYATKAIATGEGGMIGTDDEALAERCRMMSLHGISKDAWKRYTAEGSWYYEIVAPGFKYNMTDVAAGMGIAQLQKAERMHRRRTEIAARYTEAFSPLAALQTPSEPAKGQHAWHLYMLRMNLSRLTIDRNRFVEELRSHNIGTSVHFIPLHVHPYYRDRYGYRPEDYPVAFTQYLREISLPIYSKMNEQDVDDVIDAVLELVGRFGRD
jgi:dTDP-4-amino-4,6-dideoxygalactose transaminase